jgi:membrane associated rhomboid family serine protease
MADGEHSFTMGIYDRDYTRQSSRSSLGSVSGWSVNTWIIVVNIAVFVLEIASHNLGALLVEFGHFSTYAVSWAGGLQFWRFLTFQFLHANAQHVLFNMLGLYVFGGAVEEYLGRQKYLAFYLTCGVFGAFMYLLLNALGNAIAPSGSAPWSGPIHVFLFNDTHTPLVGASAGVLGVIMACAYVAPDMQIQLLFPPVTMRTKTMAYLYVGIAVMALVFGFSNAGGEAAHLGGAIAGAFFVRNSHLLRDFFDVFTDSRRPKRPQPGKTFSESLARSRDERQRDEKELDRILDKARVGGLASLSDSERATLSRETDIRRAGR